MSKQRRKVYLDIMRIIAIFLVIFNHSDGYYLFAESEGIKFWICAFITMTTRVNVPLFLMISGALLLKKEEDYKTVFCKRITRFLLIICIFTFAYNYLFIHRELWDCIRGLFRGDFENSYWFLYAYLGLLILLPFMQRIAKGFVKQDFIVLLVINLIFSSLIMIANVLLARFGLEGILISNNLKIPLATEKVFFYPLIGYYLEHHIDIKSFSLKKIFVLILIALLGIFVSSGFTYYEAMTRGVYTQNYVQLFDYVSAIVIFIIIKYLFEVLFPSFSESKSSIFINKVAPLTFGMYLLDPFLYKVFTNEYLQLIEYCGKMKGSIFWCIISMSLGGTITYILKKLPVFKRIL